MFFDLSQLRFIRKKLKITQAELARKAGISQSMIAKIEAGTLEPTFSKFKKIVEALKSFEKKREPKIRDFYSKKIPTVDQDDNLKAVIRTMQKNQTIEVFVKEKKENSYVGIITDDEILKSLNTFGHELFRLKAKDVMKELPPIVDVNYSLSQLIPLLETNKAILVSEKGRVKGFIEKRSLVYALISLL